jgi:hypothetical protein
MVASGANPMACQMCRFPGSDLRLAGCGCTIHAVSSILVGDFHVKVIRKAPSSYRKFRPVFYSSVSENKVLGLGGVEKTDPPTENQSFTSEAVLKRSDPLVNPYVLCIYRMSFCASVHPLGSEECFFRSS